MKKKNPITQKSQKKKVREALKNSRKSQKKQLTMQLEHKKLAHKIQFF